jgi:hypothetical protein
MPRLASILPFLIFGYLAFTILRALRRKRECAHIHEYRDGQGHLVYFEVENDLISRGEVARVASKVSGVRMIKRPRRTWPAEDRFCVFEFDGVLFAVDEDFGDNDRYWVGPIQPTGYAPQTEIIYSVFARHL